MRYPFTATSDLPEIMDIPSLSGDWVRAYGDDGTVKDLLEASMLYAEGFCDQPLFGREFKVKLPAFGCGGFLPGINANVTGITYDTLTEAGQTLAPAGYTLDNGSLSFVASATSALSPKSVTIAYTAGFNPDKIPKDIELALKLLVAYYYDNRANSVAEKRTAAENLLQNYKLY